MIPWLYLLGGLTQTGNAGRCLHESWLLNGSRVGCSMEAARGEQGWTCCLHINACRLTLPAADMQEDVDIEPDTTEHVSTATQSDNTSRPFSRHWEGAQPDTAAQDGDDWWNHLLEVSAEQLSHDACSLA